MAFVITKPLAEHQVNYIATINQMASDKITAKYPIYKQLNIARTSDAEIMNTWVDSIRALAQAAKAVIHAAPSIVEIRAAITDFTTGINTF
jgi:ABC-type Na+ transport system ATPase subunit NatA